jgi:hypothetical protein
MARAGGVWERVLWTMIQDLTHIETHIDQSSRTCNLGVELQSQNRIVSHPVPSLQC